MSNQRVIRAASSAAARRRGAHSLAPEHLGDATAAATVAVIVGGIALVITGIGIVALSLTIGSRFGSSPPPDVGAIGLLPLVGGIAAIVFGGLLTAGGVAVLADVRRSRFATGWMAALGALLAAAATVRVMTNPPADPVLAIALTVVALVFGVAALLLLRPRR